MEKNNINRLDYAIRIPLLFLIVIWSVKTIEVFLAKDFISWGVLPRTMDGLKGVLFMPFIHGDLTHAAHNSIPIFVLSAILIYFYRKTSWIILTIGTLLTGLLTWLIASKAYHVGASGVVYMLASYIFFSGVFRKELKLMAMSLLTSFLYGSMVWGVLPTEYTIQEHISWEGHLAGAVVGLFLAYRFKRIETEPKVYYEWEYEPFNECEEEDKYWIVEEEEPKSEKPLFEDLF